MKKLAVILISILSFSCSHDFLKVYPETSLNEGNFYKTQEEYLTLVSGCYIPLRDIEKVTHWVISELKSDNLARQHSSIAGESSRGVIDWFLATAGNDTYSAFWNNSYQGIYRCNKAIEQLEISNDNIWQSSALKNRAIGEAYFLRALYFFNLVRQFGDIPRVNRVITTNEALQMKRDPVELIYNDIISDLTTASVHMGKATEAEEKGHANESAALGLLGKVYLTRKNYTEAEKVLQKVIALQKFSLRSDYKDIFNPLSKDYTETLFSIQYAETSSQVSNGFIFFNVPYTSKGEITGRPNVSLPIAGSMRPTQDLLDAFEEGDKRKATAIKFWTGPDWDNKVTDIPYCGKYYPPQTATLGWCGDNFPILRYADILLMYAEALNSQGKVGEASNYVMQVRRRAGLDNDISQLSQQELDLLIEKERQTEFCFENQRWYDLVRRDRVLEIMQKHGEKEKSLKSFLEHDTFVMESYKLLSPIPAEQILINKLSQNPGY